MVKKGIYYTFDVHLISIRIFFSSLLWHSSWTKTLKWLKGWEICSNRHKKERKFGNSFSRKWTNLFKLWKKKIQSRSRSEIYMILYLSSIRSPFDNGAEKIKLYVHLPVCLATSKGLRPLFWIYPNIVHCKAVVCDSVPWTEVSSETRPVKLLLCDYNFIFDSPRRDMYCKVK